MFPIVIWIDGPPNLDIFVNSWVAVIGLAFLLIALAYILYFATLARAGASNLLLLTLLIPPFAIYLGQLSFDKRLGPKALVGFAIIALGLAVTDERLIPHFHKTP
jgi:drug/metabolite transporter (DMT)-like permease